MVEREHGALSSNQGYSLDMVCCEWLKEHIYLTLFKLWLGMLEVEILDPMCMTDLMGHLTRHEARLK